MGTLNEDLATMLATLQHHLAEPMMIVDREIQISFDLNSALCVEPMILTEGRTWHVTACTWAPDHGLDSVVELDGHTDAELPEFLRDWLNERDRMNNELADLLRSNPWHK